MKKYGGAVRIIATVYTVLYILAVIGIIVALVLQAMSWIDALILFISMSVSVVLVWALDSVLIRVDALERVLAQKGAVTESELEEAVDAALDAEEERILPETEGLRYCSVCGYQLFPEDEVCPNCGAAAGDGAFREEEIQSEEGAAERTDNADIQK